MFLRPSHADELDDAVGGVVPETPVGFDQRDDAVVAGERRPRRHEADERGIILFVLVFFVDSPKIVVAAVGVDQPRRVEAVAAHHAADGVGEQALDVFFAVGTVEGDLLVGDFGRAVRPGGRRPQ